MLDVNLLRRDFVYFSFNSGFLGLKLFLVILSTIRIKSTASCAVEALQLAELFVLSFVIGSLTFDNAFSVSETFPGD